MPKCYLITFLLFISMSLSATIINIPADQPTIQAGINATAEADTVLVAPGTYTDNINYNGKNILVTSWYITAADSSYIDQTIIDGDQIDKVVTFESGEDSTAVLCGFTIQNGAAAEGGGIFCEGSSPILDHLLIKDCNATRGGAIYCNNASPTLSNCSLASNTATFGGSIYAEIYSHPELINTILWNNTPQEVYFSDEDFLMLQEIPDMTTNEADNNIVQIDLNEYIINSVPFEDLTIDATAEFSAIDGDVFLDEDQNLIINFFPVLDLAYHVGNEAIVDLTIEHEGMVRQQTFVCQYQPGAVALQGMIFDLYTEEVVTGSTISSSNNIGQILLIEDHSEFISFHAVADTAAIIHITGEDYYPSDRLIEFSEDTLLDFTIVPNLYDSGLGYDPYMEGYDTSFRWLDSSTVRHIANINITICDIDTWGHNPSPAEVQQVVDILDYYYEATRGLITTHEDGNTLITTSYDECMANGGIGYLGFNWDTSIPGSGANSIYLDGHVVIGGSASYQDNIGQGVISQEAMQILGPHVDQDYIEPSVFCDDCTIAAFPTSADMAWCDWMYSRQLENYGPDTDPGAEPSRGLRKNNKVYDEVKYYYTDYINGEKVYLSKLLGYSPIDVIVKSEEEILKRDDLPPDAVITKSLPDSIIIDVTPADWYKYKISTFDSEIAGPQNFSYTLDDDAIAFEWDTVISEDIESYNLYMSCNNGPFTLLTQTEDTQYENILVESGIYRFYITSVFSDNTISMMSQIVEIRHKTDAVARFTRLCPKSTPKLSYETDREDINLSWQVMPTDYYARDGELFFMEYCYSLIYASYEGSPYHHIGKVDSTNYMFAANRPGTYTFYVQAVYNQDQITPESNAVSTYYDLEITGTEEKLIQLYSYANETKQKANPVKPKDLSRAVDLSSITISYSDIQGGEAAIISNDMADVYWQEGNLDEDPLFDTSHHLTEGSPCIDAGDPGFPLDPNNTIIDMGALYYPDQGIVVDDIFPEPGEITISEGDSINFYITAYDPDSEDLEYSWELDGEVASTDSIYLFLTDNNSSGELEVTLNVTDNFTARESRNTLNFAWNVIVEDVSSTNEEVLPIVTAIYQNVPNPFNPETTIRFDLSNSVDVKLDIYNVKGQKIKTLVNTTLEPGVHTYIWQGEEDNGSPVASGVYFYKLKAGEFEQVRKMMVLK